MKAAPAHQARGATCYTPSKHAALALKRILELLHVAETILVFTKEALHVLTAAGKKGEHH